LSDIFKILKSTLSTNRLRGKIMATLRGSVGVVRLQSLGRSALLRVKRRNPKTRRWFAVSLGTLFEKNLMEKN
jgi:hypothetical protein